LWWINYISDYSRRDERKKNIFKCPSKNINDLNFENYVFYGNYGVNQSICKNSPNTRRVNEFLGKPLSSSNIKNPSGTLLITDSGYSLITWRHASDKDSESLGPVYEDTGYGEDTAYIPGLKINFDRIGKSLFFGQEEDAVNGRHPKKTVNVGFVDGHVESKKADDLLVESTPAGYKNRSELWQGN
jgi:prepilin-type processing-associated H-X9-DG protein